MSKGLSYEYFNIGYRVMRSSISAAEIVGEMDVQMFLCLLSVVGPGGQWNSKSIFRDGGDTDIVLFVFRYHDCCAGGVLTYRRNCERDALRSPLFRFDESRK